MHKEVFCVPLGTLGLYETEAFAGVEPPNCAFSSLSLNWCSRLRCVWACLKLKLLELLLHLGLTLTLRHSANAPLGEGRGAELFALARTAPPTLADTSKPGFGMIQETRS